MSARRTPGRQSGSRAVTSPSGPTSAGLTLTAAAGLGAAFRLHRAEWKPADWDIVVNPRKAAIAAPFAYLERALAKVIEKCGHL